MNRIVHQLTERAKEIDVLEKSQHQLVVQFHAHATFYQFQTIHIHKFSKEFLMLENSEVEGKK